MITARDLEQQGLSDLVYLCAVVRALLHLLLTLVIFLCTNTFSHVYCLTLQAQYRRGSYQAARAQITEYLKVSSHGVTCKDGIHIQNLPNILVYRLRLHRIREQS